MSNMGGDSPVGRMEAGASQTRTVAPASHTNPPEALVAKNATDISTDSEKTEKTIQSANPAKAFATLSPATMRTVKNSLSAGASGEAAARKTEASRRLVQSAKNAATAHREHIETYNKAINQYFDKMRKTRLGQVLDKLAQQNGMTLREVIKAVMDGRAQQLGASPNDEKDISAHVQGANREGNVKQTWNAMLKTGAIFVMAARSMAVEHATHANDPAMDEDSLPELAEFSEGVSEGMRMEIGDEEPIDTGNGAMKPKTVMDSMDITMDKTTKNAFEKFGKTMPTASKQANN